MYAKQFWKNCLTWQKYFRINVQVFNFNMFLLLSENLDAPKTVSLLSIRLRILLFIEK